MWMRGSSAAAPPHHRALDQRGEQAGIVARRDVRARRRRWREALRTEAPAPRRPRRRRAPSVRFWSAATARSAAMCASTISVRATVLRRRCKCFERLRAPARHARRASSRRPTSRSRHGPRRFASSAALPSARPNARQNADRGRGEGRRDQASASDHATPRVRDFGPPGVSRRPTRRTRQRMFEQRKQRFRRCAVQRRFCDEARKHARGRAAERAAGGIVDLDLPAFKLDGDAPREPTVRSDERGDPAWRLPACRVAEPRPPAPPPARSPPRSIPIRSTRLALSPRRAPSNARSSAQRCSPDASLRIQTDRGRAALRMPRPA